MSLSISYSLAALHEASKFIWEKNEGVSYWPISPKSAVDVMAHIKRTMIRGAIQNATILQREKKLSVKIEDGWTTYIGTGGYYLLYELISDDDDNKIHIGIDILINPAVGHPSSNHISEDIEMPVEVDKHAVE